MVTSWFQRERPRKQRRVRLLRTDGPTEAEAGIAAGPFFLSFYVHRSVAEGAERRKKGTSKSVLEGGGEEIEEQRFSLKKKNGGFLRLIWTF